MSIPRIRAADRCGGRACYGPSAGGPWPALSSDPVAIPSYPTAQVAGASENEEDAVPTADDHVPGGPADRGPSTEPASSGSDAKGFPDRSLIDLSRDPTPGVPDHAAPDDAGDRPLIDLSRDPTPGVPDHAAPDDAPDAPGRNDADAADNIE